MKHIKLFEQMDEEESWWDEESPFDNIKDLRIIQFKGGSYYILKGIKGDKITLFDENEHYDYWLKDFNMNPKVDDDTTIYIIDALRRNYKFDYQYKNLPKEIKDRLI